MNISRPLRWIAALASAALLVGLGGCEPNTELRSNTIRIGVACPLTGRTAAIGEQIKKGAELAVDQINARGGVNGRTFALAVKDDEGKPETAEKVAKELVKDPSVAAVVGHYNSACSAAGREVYKKAHMPQLSPGSTNVDVCRLSEWTFRNLFHDGYQGQSIARYIKKELGYGTVAVFYDDDDYGRGLKDAYLEEAEKIGLITVFKEAYSREGEKDYTGPLDEIKTLEPDPDIIFISGLYNEAADIAKEAREKNIEKPIIGGDGLYSTELIYKGKENVEGVYVTTPFIVHPDVGGPAAQKFRTAYIDKYGGKSPDTWAALSYDAVNMIAEALEASGFDRAALRDQLAGVNSPSKAFRGITGLTYFDEYGDCPKQAYIGIVQNGKFEPAPVQFPSIYPILQSPGGEPAPEQEPGEGESVPEQEPAGESSSKTKSIERWTM